MSYLLIAGSENFHDKKGAKVERPSRSQFAPVWDFQHQTGVSQVRKSI